MHMDSGTPTTVQFRCDGAEHTGAGWCEVSAVVEAVSNASGVDSPLSFRVHGTARCARGYEASCATLHPLADRHRAQSGGPTAGRAPLSWPATFTIQVHAKPATEEWIHVLLRKDEEVLEAAGRTVAHVSRDKTARKQVVALYRLLAIQALAKEQAKQVQRR